MVFDIRKHVTWKMEAISGYRSVFSSIAVSTCDHHFDVLLDVIMLCKKVPNASIANQTNGLQKIGKRAQSSGGIGRASRGFAVLQRRHHRAGSGRRVMQLLPQAQRHLRLAQNVLRPLLAPALPHRQLRAPLRRLARLIEGAAALEGRRAPSAVHLPTCCLPVCHFLACSTSFSFVLDCITHNPSNGTPPRPTEPASPSAFLSILGAREHSILQLYLTLRTRDVRLRNRAGRPGSSMSMDQSPV